MKLLLAAALLAVPMFAHDYHDWRTSVRNSIRSAMRDVARARVEVMRDLRQARAQAMRDAARARSDARRAMRDARRDVRREIRTERHWRM